MDSGELFEHIGALPVVTCEDHHADSGLGAAVAMMAARSGLAIKLANMGVTRYGCSGPGEEVMADMKLAPRDIADTVKGLLN